MAPAVAAVGNIVAPHPGACVCAGSSPSTGRGPLTVGCNVVSGLEAGSAHYAQSLDAPTAGSRAEERRTLIDTLGRSDQDYAAVDLAASLTSEIGRLPYLERGAIALRLDLGMKQSEIAVVLGCSQMQISRLLRRAAARLAEAMEPDVSSGPPDHPRRPRHGAAPSPHDRPRAGGTPRGHGDVEPPRWTGARPG